MPRTTTLTISLGETLSDYVASHVGAHGTYEDAGEYIRDLIRRDKERAEIQAFEELKAELAEAFAEAEENYVPMTAQDVIDRNRL